MPIIAMDGLTLTASVVELQCLVGGRIEKIQQPEKYELLFSVHTQSGGKRLIVSSSTENCRIHLTGEKKLSPIDAPNFLMLLRKHLTGARISHISQPNHDRIVLIGFEGHDELSDETSFTLVCEIMGRYSNIILVDRQNIIIDAVRRVSADMSSVRTILPKTEFSLPPVQQKSDPAMLDEADFKRILSQTGRYEKLLSANVFGLSPSVAAYLIETLGEAFGSTPDRLAVGLKQFYSALFSGRTESCIIAGEEKSVLLPFVPCGYNVKRFGSVSEAADEFYRIRAEKESIHRRTASLEKVLTTSIQRLERKAEKFAVAISDEAEIERLRLFGELLTANIYALRGFAKEAVVSNYYSDPPEQVVIPLDETRSASENAQIYFKKYQKAKSARNIALVKHREAMQELEYLRGILADLSQCLTEADFDDIRAELAAGGYIRENRKKKVKLPSSRPHRFVSTDGFDIYAGKNNTQNDKLTFKEGSPNDIWLHTKDIHGSHVIIRCAGPVPDSTLLEAAMLAAYFSQARGTASVPVDYTLRRFVKKPTGAKPGMVIYTNQRTLLVVPDPSLPDKLRKKQS